ncbi:hypothetical protein WR25_04157 [Diploscapter pachys]|uniref:Uncharacterized protein n=1 Tax=Diploscapter pachys TaxID=2018661 RepID=A0A2A2J561_9BILA|nr:hypothetical protein WR25_04157 [Diploscapter pachys]
MPCGNRVVYTTCPNSGRRIVSETTTHTVAPVGASTVYYSSGSGLGSGGAAYSSSSSSKSYSSSSSGHAIGGLGGSSYHYESRSSSGGGGLGSGAILETHSTGLGLAPRLHIDSGLSTRTNMDLMRAEMEMDSAMLGTGRTTVIGTTGLHSGLTGGSYVERSSYSSTAPAYVEKSSYYSSSSSGGRFI